MLHTILTQTIQMANQFLWLSVGIREGCDVTLVSNRLLLRPEKVQALLTPTKLHTSMEKIP